MTDQPTFTDGVVWLTPWVDPDPEARRRHGEEVALRWQRAWASGEELAFAVRRGPDGEAIGTAELRPAPRGAADISYSITPAWRRRGYAARAVRLLADAGIEQVGFERIELRCDVDNVASARTAERAGFAFERIDPEAGLFGHVPEWRDVGPRGERIYGRSPSSG